MSSDTHRVAMLTIIIIVQVGVYKTILLISELIINVGSL